MDGFICYLRVPAKVPMNSLTSFELLCIPWKPNIALRTSLETILLHFFMRGVRVVTRLRTSAESDCIPAIPMEIRKRKGRREE